MKLVDRIKRNLRQHPGSGNLQSFYGAIARTNPDGGPHYSESKRDFERVRTTSDRYMLF